jgi:sugar phosphate isomerase/epimerase
MAAMYNRREMGRMTLAGLGAPLLGAFAHAASDVRVGVQTCSFRGLTGAPGADPIQTIIEALRACDVRECELFAPQVEARFGGEHAAHRSMSSMSPQMMRRELRKWRLRAPMSYFRAIGDQFRKAGVVIHAYGYSPDRTFTDQEIDFGFAAAKALGAEMMSTSTTLDVAKRIAPFAERHGMVVALRSGAPANHPDEIASPPGLAATLKLSTYFRVSVDVGHFTAANVDTVAYLREQHAHIANLYLRDRRRNEGEDLPWGRGDAPIREVLQLLKRETWPIRAYVDYDYAGESSPIEEVKRCLAYAATALA